MRLRPVSAYGHAGERQVLDVIGGKAERDIALGVGLEVDRRQDKRGIGDAGLKRGKPRCRNACGQLVIVVALQSIGGRHSLPVQRGRIVHLAHRNNLALEIGDGFNPGLPIRA